MDLMTIGVFAGRTRLSPKALRLYDRLGLLAPARVDPDSGAVLERLEMPPGANVSGLESDGAGLFYCGGGCSGKVRAVRRPKAAG